MLKIIDVVYHDNSLDAPLLRTWDDVRRVLLD